MIKSMLLSFVLVTSFVGTVHAQGRIDSTKSSGHSKKEEKKKDNKKEKDEEKPTYLDLSGPVEDDNAMPAITPKGKL